MELVVLKLVVSAGFKSVRADKLESVFKKDNFNRVVKTVINGIFLISRRLIIIEGGFLIAVG